MPRFKLTIEYAGTKYSGWQIQQNARTVQGEIARAARTVTGRKDFELYGSGRTDAGVHALGQVAHLDVSTSLPPDTLRQRLNDELPADINILAAVVVPHRFHARHAAVARRYLYQITTRRTAFSKPFVWWVKERLDLESMRGVAARFVGMHDFSSFAASDADEPEPSSAFATATPVKKVLLERLEIRREGALILISVEGSHFLWRMVRRLVGVLVAVGKGDLEVDAAVAMLNERSALPAKLTAPASGLFLDRVFYKDDPRDVPIAPATPIP
jgi:tRNA pseudouridine38-40 synthase